MPADFGALAFAEGPFRHGGFSLRRLSLHEDIDTLHGWFQLEHARFWGMQGQTVAQVRAHYAALLDSGHALACTGVQDGQPAFLVECYDPRHDELGRHYPVQAGDVGMHVCIAPPQTPRSGHTRAVFRALMHFLFDRLQAQRVVVEPDVRNERVHALNRAVGFRYDGCVRLPHKLAALAFCTRQHFFQLHPPEMSE